MPYTIANEDVESVVIEVLTTLTVRPSDIQPVEDMSVLYDGARTGAKALSGVVAELAAREGASVSAVYKIRSDVNESWDVLVPDEA